MARTPKNIEVQDVNDESIDQAAVASAMDVMRDQAQEDQADLFDLATSIGAIQAMSLVNSFTSAAQVQLFRRIRDSNKIKDLPIRSSSGELTRFTSMRAACPVIFGRTYESLLEAETRLSTFGDNAYETAARLGLNRNALRAARALPPEKLEVVRLAIEGGSTKAEVLSVIEDLAEKVQLAEAATDEVKAELKASEEVLATKNKTIDRLQRAVAGAAVLDDVAGDARRVVRGEVVPESAGGIEVRHVLATRDLAHLPNRGEVPRGEDQQRLAAIPGLGEHASRAFDIRGRDRACRTPSVGTLAQVVGSAVPPQIGIGDNRRHVVGLVTEHRQGAARTRIVEGRMQRIRPQHALVVQCVDPADSDVATT